MVVYVLVLIFKSFVVQRIANFQIVCRPTYHITTPQKSGSSESVFRRAEVSAAV